MSDMEPDWNVAIIDGQPEMVINLAGVGVMAKYSPLGVDECLRRLRLTRTPDGQPAFSSDQIEQIAAIARGDR